MEIVVVTRSRNIGLDEDFSGLNDYDYLLTLPYFSKSFGLLSYNSIAMLDKDLQKAVEKNQITTLKIRKKYSIFRQKDKFLIYKLNNINPILYEVCGFNCLINQKVGDYTYLELVKSFYYTDGGFVKEDFDNLEKNVNYIICSYYEGEAIHLYTDDCLADKIIVEFEKLCFEKCGLNVNISRL